MRMHLKSYSLGTASAYIEGYRVGENWNSANPIDGVYVLGKYILSFRIAPTNDPQVSAYIAINQPSNNSIWRVVAVQC